jgi:hypothetical protein
MKTGQEDYIEVKDMALKYNCSFQTVRKFAIKNSVPYEEFKYGKKLFKSYKFYPEYENLFANQKKIRYPTLLPKTCLIIYYHKKHPEILIFKTLNSAFRYAVKLVSGKLSFFTPYSVLFQKYINTADKNTKSLILSFVKKNPLKGYFLSLLSFGNSNPIPFDFSDSNNKIKIIHSLSSDIYAKFTCVEQKQKETNHDFCNRIFLHNENKYNVPLSLLHKTFRTKKRDLNEKK